MDDGSSGKLYYLRGRGRRSAARATRRRLDGAAASSGDRRRPSPEETVWLARALFAEAAYLAFYWFLVFTDLLPIVAKDGSALWLYSFLPADLFVAVVAGVGGYDLLRKSGKGDVFVVLAAGGLIFLSLERLAYRIPASVQHHLTPGERLEITAMGVCLCVGIWAISHSLRSRAER